MKGVSSSLRSSSGIYFVYTGCTIALVLMLAYLGGLQHRAWDTILMRDVIALVPMTAGCAALAFAVTRSSPGYLRERLARFLTPRADRLLIGLAAAATALYFVVALTLLTTSHRRFLIAVALLQVCTIYVSRRPMPARTVFAVLLLSIATWGLSSGLTYTNLGDWLLNSASSSLAVPAFVFSFGLVLLELSDDRLDPIPFASPRAALAGALLLFIAFSFRSDNLLNSWVPYHRSFVADVAQLVREGHWLLWDIPSLYGFLSMAAVAAVPAHNAWQGLFILTASIQVVQACIIFTLWRWGRAGWANFTFAALLSIAVFGDSISRYPWSGRLYPQGGLRFIWVLALLFTVFLSYVWRQDNHRVRLLCRLGHGMWAISLFWSFEAAVWSSVLWLPYVALFATISGPRDLLSKRLIDYLWPLVALPIVGISTLETYYRVALGHAPDLFSFVEFSGIFVSGTIRASFPTNPDGAGWSVVLALGALGCVLIAAIRKEAWETLPLLTATWFAVWGTSTYFAVEPFDGHVSLLLPVMISAAAIVTFVSREALAGDAASLLARLSMAPIGVVCIALLLGEPARLVTMKFPLMPGWTSNTLASFPPVPPELASLAARAGIGPGDGVLIPNRQYWTEISQGMIFPTTRAPNGELTAYRAWAPLSPLGIQGSILGLPADRRRTYIERFLDRSRTGGWYIEYRAPANCPNISGRLITARTVDSFNYSASLCRFVEANPRKSLHRPSRSVHDVKS